MPIRVTGTDCLKFSLKALKKLLIIAPSSFFTILRVTVYMAIVDAPIVKTGMLHRIQRTESMPQSNTLARKRFNLLSASNSLFT